MTSASRIMNLVGRDAVVHAVEPRLQVAENQVDDRQVVLGDVWFTALGNGQVLVTVPREGRVALVGVGNDHLRRRIDLRLHESHARLGRAIGDDREPQATGVTSTTARLSFAVLALGLRDALADFDRADHDDLIGDAASLAARASADVGLIDFDVQPRADLAARGRHTAAQLVENLERGLVAGQAELALQLDGGHAGREARDQERGPEPRGERRVCALHDGASGECRVALAALATQDAGAVGESERLGRNAALGAREAIAPSDRFEVASARRIVREHLLKLGERLRELVGHAHRLTASVLIEHAECIQGGAQLATSAFGTGVAFKLLCLRDETLHRIDCHTKRVLLKRTPSAICNAHRTDDPVPRHVSVYRIANTVADQQVAGVERRGEPLHGDLWRDTFDFVDANRASLAVVRERFPRVLVRASARVVSVNAQPIDFIILCARRRENRVDNPLVWLERLRVVALRFCLRRCTRDVDRLGARHNATVCVFTHLRDLSKEDGDGVALATRVGEALPGAQARGSGAAALVGLDRRERFHDFAGGYAGAFDDLVNFDVLHMRHTSYGFVGCQPDKHGPYRLLYARPRNMICV